jgi:hypothetical protein
MLEVANEFPAGRVILKIQVEEVDDISPLDCLVEETVIATISFIVI